MTVRFINVNPIWNSFSIEMDKRTNGEVCANGDVDFEVEDYQGGSINFTITIEDMKEIVEKYESYMEKRAVLKANEPAQ